MNVNSLSSKSAPIITSSNDSIQPGRILKGSVLKLFPNQKAQIQLGNKQMVAQLKASLTIGTSYHFQVQSVSKQSIHLKVLGKELKDDEQVNATQLLNQLGLKSSRSHASFVQRLLTDNVPFNQAQLTEALHIWNQKPNKAMSYYILREMLSNQMPINDSIYQAIYHSKNTPLQEQIALFMNVTNQSNSVHATIVDQLQSMISNQSTNDNMKESFFNLIRSTLGNLGLDYENQLLNGKAKEASYSVKAMLLSLLKQSNGANQDTTKQFIELINGMQLQSVRETSEFIYTHVQLPGQVFDLKKDIHLQFDGKKNGKGEVDPSHCHIVFFLELHFLKETIIDMNIQSRHVSIMIMNNTPQLNDQIQTVKPILKQGLEELDYHLSAITIKPYEKEQGISNVNVNTWESEVYKGVDYRI